MRFRVKIFLTACLLFVFSAARAAEKETYRWQATLTGGLYLNNEQAWQLEPAVTWNFHKLLGVGLGVELSGQYNQPSRLTVIDGREAVLTSNERDVAWIMLKPMLVIKSPEIWKTADRFYRLWVQAEPGLSLGCPFHNSLTYEIKEYSGAIGHTVDYRKFPNQGLRWFYWNARASVNLAIDRFIIGAGYYVSNLDYYSGRRNVTLANGEKFHVPKKEISQSVFLSVGYTF